MTFKQQQKMHLFCYSQSYILMFLPTVALCRLTDWMILIKQICKQSSHGNLPQFLFVDVQPCSSSWLLVRWFRLGPVTCRVRRPWPMTSGSRCTTAWSRTSRWLMWPPRWGRRPTWLWCTSVLWILASRWRRRSLWVSRLWLTTSWPTTTKVAA